MTTLAVLSELDAAEALLELQRDNREKKSCGKESTLPMATFLYNLIGSRPSNTSTPKTSPCNKTKVLSEPKSQYDSKSNKRGMLITPEVQYRTHQNAFNNNVQCKVPKQEAVITKVWSDNLNERLIKITKAPKITHDKATQTEIEYQMPEIEKMENVIRGLCSKIEALENRLKSKKSESSSLADSVTDQNTDISNDDQTSRSNSNYNRKRSYKRKRTSTINTDFGDYNTTSANTTYMDMSNDETEMDKEYSNSSKNLKSSHNNRTKSDMVSIGDGNAIVPSKVIKNMDWSSYTNATRKLLTAVFSRKVLATHSLTGKPSPAFPDKPAKKKLNSSLVNDIVQTVVDKCHVPESVVRTSITTKCADESKMFRSRQQNKKKRVSNKRNIENVPPRKYESDDSDESYLSS
ncbi:uncharacterized protein [Epargyreus clarus]|uniref:uncharacterized protein n=1 Tax=Epargyreus clarus TaxID=520877 RepID=UPI003C30DEDF